MSRNLLVLGLTIVLASIGAVAVADSHEGPYYVWVNLVKAKPGQSDALVARMIEEDSKIYDPLVESGAALEWGIALPVVHPETESHAQWVTFAGWAGVDTFMGNFMAAQQSMSPEERAATNEAYAALVEPGTHRDMINRVAHVGTTDVVRPGYIHLAYFSAKPGMDEDAMEMFGAFNPIFDELVADGTIQNYGTHVPALHRGEEWTHMGWWASQGLAARDAVFAKMMSSDNEAMERWPEVFDAEHIDQILLVVHHKTADGGE